MRSLHDACIATWCVAYAVAGTWLWAPIGGSQAYAEAQQAGSPILWNEADGLKAAGQYEAAAQRYQQLATQRPGSPEAQKAAIHAASCLEQMGRLKEAAALYDQVVAWGDAAARPGKRPKKAVAYWMKEALYRKAVVSHQMGETAEGARAADRLRAEFPKSNGVADLAALKAGLEGLGPDQVEAMKTAERDALRLYEESAAKAKAKDNAGALAGLDSVLTQYPNSAAVLPALNKKGLLLWQSKRYDEAREAYTQVLAKAKTLAPNSPLVRTAEYRVAWLDSGRLMTDLIRKRRANKPATPDLWQRVRDLCGTVIEKDPTPLEQAQARVMIIESFVWQHQYGQAIEQATKFLEQYKIDQDGGKFARPIAWAHLFAGYAHRQLHQYEKGLEHDRWVTQTLDTRGNPLGEELAPHAYYGIWKTLRSAGAPDRDVREAANTLANRFPRSSYNGRIRVHAK